jgi:hypothetical protein
MDGVAGVSRVATTAAAFDGAFMALLLYCLLSLLYMGYLS